MTVEAAIIAAVLILSLSFFGLIAFIFSRRQAAKDEALQQAAAARGWRLEVTSEKGYRIERWTGTTGGISWVAESAVKGAGSKQHRKRDVGRWHGAYSPGISGAVIILGLPRGREALGTAVPDGEGFFARMAQKAAGFALDKAVDGLFGDVAGKEVDAAAMHRIESELPGYVVMATDKSEGARVMQQGLEKLLQQSTSSSQSALSAQDRPSILLRPAAISIARTERFRDINELEGFVKAGVALPRAFKFGRAGGLKSPPTA